MSSYTHFTEEEKEQAGNTDLVSFLRHRGETLKRSGSEYEWKSDSGKVTMTGERERLNLRVATAEKKM